MIGLYFSGTGNTAHAVKKLVTALDPAARIYRLEDSAARKALTGATTVVLGYPVYFSNLPKIVRDFITDTAALFAGKKVFIVATMGLFSGDGSGCAARLLRRQATILGGLHLKMPDCIGDSKLLKKSPEQIRKIIDRADERIMTAARKINVGKFPQDGLSLAAHLAGLFGQRLYFPNKTKSYYQNLKVDKDKCKLCQTCVHVCPMHNIRLDTTGPVFAGRCTMCYRCFSVCPQQALTILGDSVITQYRFDDYAD